MKYTRCLSTNHSSLLNIVSRLAGKKSSIKSGAERRIYPQFDLTDDQVTEYHQQSPIGKKSLDGIGNISISRTGIRDYLRCCHKVLSLY